MVRKVDSGYSGNLQESDIILTLNGHLITRVANLDIQYHHTTLDAVIVRHRKTLEVKVPTVPTTDLETTRAVVFSGAILHRPHHAVRQQISKVHSDVYISGRQRGSPAYAYGLGPTNFITHVNGVSTPDLDAFLKEVKKVPDNTYFRLKVMTFDNVPWVATMKKCEHYFPTVEFVKDANSTGSEGVLAGKGGTGAWRKVVHEADIGGADGMVGAGEVLDEAGGPDNVTGQTGGVEVKDAEMKM
jgi:hypothetical protein